MQGRHTHPGHLWDQMPLILDLQDRYRVRLGHKRSSVMNKLGTVVGLREKHEHAFCHEIGIVLLGG